MSANIARTTLPGLHRIALPTPFPVGDVNVYLAEGEPLTLIDCGVRNEETRQALAGGLAALGYRLSDIERLIITHHHTDHRGLVTEVVAESGAEVWAHPYGVRWLEEPHEMRSALRYFTDTFFREGGVPDSVVETVQQIGHFIESLAGTARVTMTIDEGEWVELVGFRWEVYYMPGHAGDLLCFYQPEKRVLLSSDHLLRDISSNPLIEAPRQPGEPRPKRLLDYLRELRRVATLDVGVAYPGHGDPVLNVRSLVDSRLAFHEQRAGQLYTLFGGQPRTLYELAKLMFPRVHDAEMFLALSEVLGHLDMLARDSWVVEEKCNGLVRWLPVGRQAVG